MGVSAPLAYKYVKRGWLTKLDHAVFGFPSDELQRHKCVSFLAKRMSGLHVGGKTALAWRGVLHNVPAREQMILWGRLPGRLPVWFTSRFPSRYISKRLFDSRMSDSFGLSALPELPDGPHVSEPERALLEMLSEVGLRQSTEEGRQIMEGARALRSEIIGTLLRHCLRVKVIRLCVQWAEELKLPWATEARRSMAKTRADNRSRWTTRMKDGTTLVLKP